MTNKYLIEPNELFSITYCNKEIHFEFGGFDHTIHEDIVEYGIEYYFDKSIDEIANNAKEWDSIDFRAIEKNYSKALLEAIDKKFKVNFLESFKEVYYPKQYNYVNNSIVLEANKINSKTLDFIKNNYQEIKTFLNDYYNLLELEFDIIIND